MNQRGDLPRRLAELRSSEQRFKTLHGDVQLVVRPALDEFEKGVDESIRLAWGKGGRFCAMTSFNIQPRVMRGPTDLRRMVRI